MRSSYSNSSLLCWVLSALVSIHSALALATPECNIGEKLLDFTFFLDEDSYMENGWTMACNGEEAIFWNVPIGTLQWSDPNAHGYTHPDAEIPFVKEQACISKEATCHFNLQDFSGDGLEFPGYYYLALDDEIIAVSDEWEEFEEKQYCFGPNCPKQQQVQEDCDTLHFFFQTDDAPEENSVAIECGGDSIVSRSEFRAPHEAVHAEKCIPLDLCCTLTIKDSAGNGMDPLKGGNAFLEWSDEVIFQYVDSNVFDFDTLHIQFGRTCQPHHSNDTSWRSSTKEY